MSLPHIKNSKAGMNREMPWFKNLFEVYFSIPAALQAETGAEDVNVLTEQVTGVDGLDSLTPTPDTVQQKFMGTTRTYLGTMPGETSHTITVHLNLNIRKATDNYIFKLFKKWNNLGYNMSTGERSLKDDYVADFLRIVQFNPAGDVFRDVKYNDMILSKVSGLDSLSYDNGTDYFSLEVEFKSDWADDVDA